MICAIALPPGSRAIWDGIARTVTCSSCSEDLERAPQAEYVAGASADREYARRVAKREAKRSEAGRLKRFAMWMGGEPQSIGAWKKGARGERIVGARLDELRNEDMAVFHDLRVPGTRANIDHVVVAPSGIHVIDPKLYKGRVELKDKGGLFRSDVRLLVGGRDRTKLVEKLASQILVVDRVTVDVALPTVVTPVLCFVEAEWGIFTKPLQLSGVHILWPKALMKLLRRPGPLSADQIDHAAQRIRERLRPA